MTYIPLQRNNRAQFKFADEVTNPTTNMPNQPITWVLPPVPTFPITTPGQIVTPEPLSSEWLDNAQKCVSYGIYTPGPSSVTLAPNTKDCRTKAIGCCNNFITSQFKQQQPVTTQDLYKIRQMGQKCYEDSARQCFDMNKCLSQGQQGNSDCSSNILKCCAKNVDRNLDLDGNLIPIPYTECQKNTMAKCGTNKTLSYTQALGESPVLVDQVTGEPVTVKPVMVIDEVTGEPVMLVDEDTGEPVMVDEVTGEPVMIVDDLAEEEEPVMFDEVTGEPVMVDEEPTDLTIVRESNSGNLQWLWILFIVLGVIGLLASLGLGFQELKKMGYLKM